MASNEQHLKHKFVAHLIDGACGEIEKALITLGQNISLEYPELVDLDNALILVERKTRSLRARVDEQIKQCNPNQQ